MVRYTVMLCDVCRYQPPPGDDVKATATFQIDVEHGLVIWFVTPHDNNCPVVK